VSAQCLRLVLPLLRGGWLAGQASIRENADTR